MIKSVGKLHSPLLLVFAVFIVFLPTLFNDFQRGWDDQWQVLDYEFVTSHSLSDLWYHFTHYHLGQYMPVNTVLYVIIYETFGFNPVAFHAASLLIHLVNALLVYAIICITIRQTKPAWSAERIRIFSFLATLAFAIHPLQVESVAWISASKIVLYSLFFLMGIRLYLNYLRTLNAWWLIGVALCYLLAYGSKEQAIIFPLNLLAFDYVFHRFKKLSFSFWSLKNTVIVEKIPFFFIALLLYAFSVSNNLGTFTTDTYPLYQRFLFSMSSFMEYLFRYIAPVKLYYFYFFPIEVGEALPLYFWVYPVLVTICIIFIRVNFVRNNRLVIFGFLLFIINIVLVLHLIPMPRKMITADRYMYFSLIGLGVTAAWFIYYLYVREKAWRKFLIPGLTAYFIFFGAHSFVRTTEWKDSDSIKKNVNELIDKRKAENKPAVDNPLQNDAYGEE